MPDTWTALEGQIRTELHPLFVLRGDRSALLAGFLNLHPELRPEIEWEGASTTFTDQLILLCRQAEPVDAGSQPLLAEMLDDLAESTVGEPGGRLRELAEAVRQNPPPPISKPASYSPLPLPPRSDLPTSNLNPLPPGSRIFYPPNLNFTGRQDDLRILANALFYDQQTTAITQPVAASGLGGIGKTQLASELSYRYAPCLDGIHWIHADQDIAAEIAACGVEMQLQPWPDKQDEQVASTLHAWRSGRRLVVLDNLEEPARLVKWLPRLEGALVLVTSRQERWPPGLPLVNHRMDVLPRSESLNLLRRLAPRLADLPDADLDPLAQRYGDLPLGLEIAGRYLQDPLSGAPAAYLQELDQAGGAYLHMPISESLQTSLTAHPLDLLATFSLSYARLAAFGALGLLAQRFFRMAGYCAPNTPIPIEIFQRCLAEGEPASSAAQALGCLADAGLARLSEAGALLHPLLAEFARFQDGTSAASSLPALADDLVGLSFQALETGLPQRFLPLRPHLPVLATAVESAGLVEAGSLWSNYGYHLWMIADYAAARENYERALRIDEAVYGLEHPKVAIRVNNMGDVLRAQGDLEGARLCFERALRIDEAAFGPDHPEVATDINNLGSVLRAQGDLEGARACCERALRIDEATYGSDHPNVATDVNNLGGVLQDQGDLVGARLCFERALRIDEAAFGPDHPQVAIFVNNMGLVLRAQGDLEGARACFERALRIDEAAFGPDHPNVAIRVNNLGRVLQDQGDLEGARACFERALRIREVYLGKDHPKTQLVRRNLARLDN